MKKDLLILGFVILIIVVLCSGVKIESVDEYYQSHLEDVDEGDPSVTMEIECKTALDHWDVLPEELQKGDYLPEDGVILPATRYALREGDTVFDILARAVKKEHIQMEYQGADANIYKSVYIQGIQYLYEFDGGPLSGWMYTVNGEAPNYGCSTYKPQDGDVIAWRYTCDLGRDIGEEEWGGEQE